MPLHDWATTRGWSGVHILWMTEILRFIKPRLPEGFRAYVGTSPVVAIDDPEGEPDVSVRRLEGGTHRVLPDDEPDPFQPDWEVAVATLEEDRSLYLERNGRLVAVVELVSPGNKDGNEKKAKYLSRYLGYLTNHVHLLLVDVHPKPYAYSFADRLAARLGVPDQTPLPSPYAISYRVSSGDSTGGWLAVRKFPLAVGSTLPEVPLAIGFPDVVPVDLETTYMAAAETAYLT